MISCLISTKKCIPRGHYEAVETIDFNTLYHNVGKRLLLLDLDNTLIPYDVFEPTETHRDWIRQLQAIGYEIILVSNNHGLRIKRAQEVLDITVVGSAKKPLKCGFKRAMRLASKHYEKAEVIVVGDQLMTDVYGAKRSGLDAILVQPIKRRSEKWYTRILRKIETSVLRRIEKKYPEIYQELKLDERG